MKISSILFVVFHSAYALLGLVALYLPFFGGSDWALVLALFMLIVIFLFLDRIHFKREVGKNRVWFLRIVGIFLGSTFYPMSVLFYWGAPTWIRILNLGIIIIVGVNLSRGVKRLEKT